ncbi:MAG: SPOR domain-containing protein [Sphingomonas sp.]
MATSGDDFRDEDRLPWLESVEPDDEPAGQTLRVIGLVLLGLVVIAALVYAVYWLQSHHHPAGGNGALIEAPAGDYKVKPDQPGGMKAEGEGAQALATSQGADNAGAAIDLNAVPEAPIAGKPAAARQQAAQGGAAHVAATVPASGGALKAEAPVSAPKALAAAAANGSVVQLGAYPDQATANAQWKRLSTRFAYLAPLGQSVEAADVNGRKVYRLRVNAGSAGAASQLCGKLKVAGEGCFVP